jgi:hypothetical protein
MRKQCVYCVYQGETFITEGTAIECAAFMGWTSPKQTQFYASPSYMKRSKSEDRVMVFKIEEDDEDET